MRLEDDVGLAGDEVARCVRVREERDCSGRDVGTIVVVRRCGRGLRTRGGEREADEERGAQQSAEGDGHGEAWRFRLEGK
jgi:hypothetical protein